MPDLVPREIETAADQKLVAAVCLRDMYQIGGPYGEKLRLAAEEAVDCLLEILRGEPAKTCDRIAACRVLLTAAEKCAAMQAGNRPDFDEARNSLPALTAKQKRNLPNGYADHPRRVLEVLETAGTQNAPVGVEEVH